MAFPSLLEFTCVCVYIHTCVCVCMHTYQVTSVVSNSCATLWTVACHAPLSMGLSRQEYWSGLTCPPHSHTHTHTYTHTHACMCVCVVPASIMHVTLLVFLIVSTWIKKKKYERKVRVSHLNKFPLVISFTFGHNI